MIRVELSHHFFPERRYAIDVLLGELLGLHYSVVASADVSTQVRLTLENGHCLEVEDAFFSLHPDGAYLKPENVPERVSFAQLPFTMEKDIPILFGRDQVEVTPSKICCGLDLFASTFFMLTRWEEVVVGTKDAHGRFPSTASLAGRAYFLHRPIVNEYVEMLWNMLLHLGCKQARRARRFDWILTHDVDFPWRWQGIGHLLKTVGVELLKRKDFSRAFESLRSYVDVVGRGRQDPYDTFSELMDLSESVGVKSEFYFMAGGLTPCDPRYELRDPRILDLLEKIGRRGHEIGFHPSYNTYLDAELWGEEFSALSHVVGMPIVKGRQHFLRFAVPTTWQIWEDFGMLYDSTVGYADAAGFRCGICDAFPVFNVLKRCQLRLREQPLIIMEASLVHYQKLSPERAQEQILGLAETVKRYQGPLTMLWHNSSFNTPEWKPYEQVYAEVITER